MAIAADQLMSLNSGATVGSFDDKQDWMSRRNLLLRMVIVTEFLPNSMSSDI